MRPAQQTLPQRAGADCECLCVAALGAAVRATLARPHK